MMKPFSSFLDNNNDAQIDRVLNTYTVEFEKNITPEEIQLIWGHEDKCFHE